MIRAEMLIRKWKPYEVVDWKLERMETSIECMVLEINFDDETLLLQPTDIDYKTQEFTANLKHISISKKLRRIK